MIKNLPLFFGIGLRQDTCEVGQVRKLLCSLWWDIGVGLLSACPQAHLALPWLVLAGGSLWHPLLFAHSVALAWVRGLSFSHTRMEAIWRQLWKGLRPQNRGTRGVGRGCWRDLRVPVRLTVRSAVVSGMELGRYRREEELSPSSPPSIRKRGRRWGQKTQKSPSPAWAGSWG